MEITIATKIKYLQGKKWLSGTVHGVQTHENEAGKVKRLLYVIDTGEDERVDETHNNKQAIEMDKRIAKLVKQGKPVIDAYNEVKEHADLPAPEPVTSTFRHPKLITVDQNEVKLA